jgi:hypothetical protein
LAIDLTAAKVVLAIRVVCLTEVVIVLDYLDNAGDNPVAKACDPLRNGCLSAMMPNCD